MHEFSLISQIVQKCLKVAHQNNATQLSEINIEVGDFAMIVDNFAQRAFDTLKKGTLAENAILNIKRTPGVLNCNVCGESSEIWFNSEKEKAAKEGNLAKYEEYEKSVTRESILLGNPNLGRNIFQCRKCGSQETELIKGKGVLIKNIRI
jgi:hydrogenase nickel incorporation protein HypA/HybF